MRPIRPGRRDAGSWFPRSPGRRPGDSAAGNYTRVTDGLRCRYPGPAPG